MNLNEYMQLLTIIRDRHSGHMGRRIKYVESRFDNRDGTVYLVSLVARGGVSKVTFSRTNDNRECNLFRKVVDFLNGVKQPENADTCTQNNFTEEQV